MHSPNDVIPVGPRAFYVTNDHGNTSELGRLVEEYLLENRSLQTFATYALLRPNRWLFLDRLRDSRSIGCTLNSQPTLAHL